MKIVADQKIPHVDVAFGRFGDLLKLESGAINNTMVHDADALIVRSETKVDEILLAGSKVRFVGTATIGTDHVDLSFLKKQEIKFASAPGCNAFAVMQYISAVLVTIASRNGFQLKEKTLGVVGVGNVGSKIVQMAKALGMTVLENDPPLARSSQDSRFVSLDELLDKADVITLHVPLAKQGSDPTFHLFDERMISKMKAGAILINSSRGPVVETEALKNALSSKRLSASVLDVWEHEPDIDVELLGLCAIGTQHIAGYSIDGKVNATRMMYEAFCKHFNFPQTWDSSRIIEPPKEAAIEVEGDSPDAEALLKIVKHCYDIEKDDESLRRISSIPPEARGKFFKQLRGNYNFRHEFTNYTVLLPKENPMLGETVKSLGFRIS